RRRAVWLGARSVAGFSLTPSAGGLLVVRDVESAAFEDQPGSAADLALDGPLVALRAGIQRLVLHRLEGLELVTTLFADVLVRGHMDQVKRRGSLDANAAFARLFDEAEIRSVVRPARSQADKNGEGH